MTGNNKKEESFFMIY